MVLKDDGALTPVKISVVCVTEGGGRSRSGHSRKVPSSSADARLLTRQTLPRCCRRAGRSRVQAGTLRLELFASFFYSSLDGYLPRLLCGKCGLGCRFRGGETRRGSLWGLKHAQRPWTRTLGTGQAHLHTTFPSARFCECAFSFWFFLTTLSSRQPPSS